MQKNQHKNKTSDKIGVQAAVYLNDFKILIYFNNGEQRIVNFVPLFSKLSGAYIKYSLPEKFKKFIVKNENIYWGKNEDVIFPAAQLYSAVFSKKPKEEIIYII